MHIKRKPARRTAAAVVILAAAGSANAAAAPVFTVKHIFGLSGNPADGRSPDSLILGNDGRLYGTTASEPTGSGPAQHGIVFKLDSLGHETILYSFAGGADGDSPAGLMQGRDFNYYGVTASGGDSGQGTVFRLTPSGTKTTLYSFAGGTDGCNPSGTLAEDDAGGLYGTTLSCGTHGRGTVFRIDPSGAETILYSFADAGDGGDPADGLIFNLDGNLYGTTRAGGSNDTAGTVFRISPDGALATLHAFASAADGAGPNELSVDYNGNLYGTTRNGGAHNAGTVYRVDLDGTESILYSFSGGADGGHPTAQLCFLPGSYLYGTTTTGGAGGAGTIFELSPDNTESVLYSFEAASVSSPTLLQYKSGNGTFYGLASLVKDQPGRGAVYSLKVY